MYEVLISAYLAKYILSNGTHKLLNGSGTNIDP